MSSSERAACDVAAACRDAGPAVSCPSLREALLVCAQEQLDDGRREARAQQLEMQPGGSPNLAWRSCGVERGNAGGLRQQAGGGWWRVEQLYLWQYDLPERALQLLFES